MWKKLALQEGYMKIGTVQVEKAGSWRSGVASSEVAGRIGSGGRRRFLPGGCKTGRAGVATVWDYTMKEGSSQP
jgi:hypothetical protein